MSIVLFTFLNLSPPCAARAARASSTGVLFAVIAIVVGAAGVVAVAEEVVVAGVVDAPGLTAAGSCAITALLINGRVSIKKYFFISNPPQPRTVIIESKTQSQV